MLAGSTMDPNMVTFQKIVSRVFMPNKLVALAKPDGYVSSHNSIIKQITEQRAKNSIYKPTAYICDNFTCGLPIYNVEQLKQTLSK